jgi:hypothetical protein
MWRQGDVLIATIESVPEGATRRSSPVLLEGELTGHAHRIEVPSTAELWECNGQLYMKVIARTTTIVHDEHNPITLDSGTYRVWRQREYSPKTIRYVSD